MHFTSFVIPQLNPPAPVLVFAPETEQEIDDLPLVTSLHRIGNEVMPYVHARALGHPLPASDRWIEAVEAYGGGAKIVLVLEPLPMDISTEYTRIETGVDGVDLPAWVPGLLMQQYKAASRDVPVSSGGDIADVMIDTSRDHQSLGWWAHVRMGPNNNA